MIKLRSHIFWQECHRSDVASFSVRANQEVDNISIDFDHLVPGRCFLRGQRIPLGSQKSHLLCPRKQALKPGSNTPGSFSSSASVTVNHHHLACVEAHHCNQVETELVGDVTYTTHRDCCLGDLCNSAVASTAIPASILTAAATALAWLLPGLWRG
nr:lymphocyte antigen 6 complex locus protein G6d [Loxodonta africana]